MDAIWTFAEVYLLRRVDQGRPLTNKLYMIINRKCWMELHLIGPSLMFTSVQEGDEASAEPRAIILFSVISCCAS